MKRDIRKLAGRAFDIVVVGGGIHGAAAAYQLAGAGYAVALLEKDDFCQATSANSLKILHGGLRYLQHGNIGRMRDSIRSRRDFMQLAPSLIEPLPCLMPTSGHGLRGRLVMRIALLLNDFISLDRNRGVPPAKRLGRGRIISRRDCLRIIPGIEPMRPTGAALWYDALILNTERMVMQLLHRAAGCGAVAVNYVKAVDIAAAGNRVQSVVAEDLLHQEQFSVACRMVLNCAGPWLPELTGDIGDKGENGCLARAVNIVVNRNFFGRYAVGLEGSSEFVDRDALVRRGKRLFFFVPWRGQTMIGTTYTHSSLDERPRPSAGDIRTMIAEINRIYPPAQLGIADVTYSHCGLVPAYNPAIEDGGAEPCLVKHSAIIDHEERGGLRGMLSVKGVKYTTAIEVARQLERIIGRKNIAGIQTLSPGRGPDRKSAPAAMAGDTDLHRRFGHIADTYGDQAAAVFKIMNHDPAAADFICTAPPLTRAEVLYAVREEMAVSVSDIVFRRTELGSGRCPLRPVLEQVASVMAAELGWQPQETARQVEDVLHTYGRMCVPQP